ncbi:hypothetical protein M426DRAFT_24057 [Hypoxylon sp. CI-4A]|nr:hypothetical protein M426DRAFT_24057 [Hypoxylon sp. CI-4A]
MMEDLNQSMFTCFSELPTELRLQIWGHALPEDMLEVCVCWPLEENEPTKPLNPFLVDTCFSVLMHVCRESRELAISKTQFRYSLLAGCLVPFRPFRPDLDVFYITLTRHAADFDKYPRGMSHLALDMHTLHEGESLWELLGATALNVRTLRCVPPAPKAIVDTQVRFRPPVRRCRLRDVVQPVDGSQSHIVYTNRDYGRRMTGMDRYLQDMKTRVLHDLEDHGVFSPTSDVSREPLQRWFGEGERLPIEFMVQTFEEYRGGRWVSSSDHPVTFEYQRIDSQDTRKAISKVKAYRVSEEERWTPLRNPETFRVNDIQQDEVQFD